MANLNIPKYLDTAFGEDFVYIDESGIVYQFYMRGVGNLKIVNGVIIACDPFLYNNDLPFTNPFPIGEFPVQLAIAKIDDDERVGLARIKFSEEIPVSWSMAVCAGQDVSSLAKDEIFGYGVDAGTGCFMDTSGANELRNFLMEKDDNYEVLGDEMEKNYKHTRNWLLWEKSGSNVALFTAGWGDGYYASYIGYDQRGSICRLVTDFGLME